jgi:hypothetical protein
MYTVYLQHVQNFTVFILQFQRRMINSGSASGAARIVAIGLKDFYCKSIPTR